MSTVQIETADILKAIENYKMQYDESFGFGRNYTEQMQISKTYITVVGTLEEETDNGKVELCHKTVVRFKLKTFISNVTKYGKLLHLLECMYSTLSMPASSYITHVYVEACNIAFKRLNKMR